MLGPQSVERKKLLSYELFTTRVCARMFLKDGTFFFAFHNGKVRKISMILIAKGNA